MEHRRRRHQETDSREIFSVPGTSSTRDQDSDFEFGCLTSESPTTDPYKNSPADHLFYNGKLLPHSFPLQQQPPPTAVAFSDNISSRTSSRKDSLTSSRSNSVNSSRSSSARTSSSENSERKSLYHNSKFKHRRSASSSMASKVVMAQLYGSSQRWQHIVPMPALKREDSKRKINAALVKNGSICNKKEDYGQEGKKERTSGLFLKFLKSFLVACRECHAMETSTEDEILQASMKL